MDTLLVQLRFKYITLIAGVLLTTLAAYSHYRWFSTDPRMQGLLPVIAGGVAVTALFYNAMNLHHSLALNEERLLTEKKAFAAGFMTEWHRPDMAKLTVIGAALRVSIKDMEPKQVLELPRDDKDKQAAVTSMLNFFEKMALSIRFGLADEAMLKDYFGGIVRMYHHALGGFINLKRREMANEEMFCRFAGLAKRWG